MKNKYLDSILTLSLFDFNKIRKEATQKLCEHHILNKNLRLKNKKDLIIEAQSVGSFYFKLFRNPKTALFFIRHSDKSPFDYVCPFCARALLQYDPSVKGSFANTCGGKNCINLQRQKTLESTVGVSNISQLESIKKKKQQSLEEHYGDSKYNKIGSESFKQRLFNIYGTLNINEVPEITNKMRQTCLKKYGTAYPQQNQEINLRSRNTKISKYGSCCVKKRYKYNNIKFDSKPELYYYIYNYNILKNNIKRGLVFPFYLNNKLHFYECDFQVEGQNIEIKGPQLWKNGRLYFPFKKIESLNKKNTTLSLNVCKRIMSK